MNKNQHIAVEKIGRSLTDKEMNDAHLTMEEREDVNSINKGEYISVAKNEFSMIKDSFVQKQKELKKKNSQLISLRLDKDDLIALKKKASIEGIPYQTFIKSKLHKLAKA